MGWQQKSGDKIISAEQAAKLVKSGALVRLSVGKASIPRFIFSSDTPFRRLT